MFGRSERFVLGVSGDVSPEDAPIRLSPQDVGASKGTKFVHAACGRSHTLLVGSDGQIWSAGANNMGQVKRPPYPKFIPAANSGPSSVVTLPAQKFMTLS